MARTCLFSLFAILSFASAFINDAAVISLAGGSALDAHPVITPSRCVFALMDLSRVRSLSSLPSLLRTRQLKRDIGTRLQFSDNDSSNTTIESSWWRKIFILSSPPSNRAATTTSFSPDGLVSSESEEQENVDAYLEFLDRRYRRLHCDDAKEGGKSRLKQNDPPVSKVKGFSALDWLTNGGKNASILTSTRDQEADALYILGVAGLASQKLLQKHHLPTATNLSIEPRMISRDISCNQTSIFVTETKLQLEDYFNSTIEVRDTKSIHVKMNHIVVKKLLLPIVRSIYLVRRWKQAFSKIVRREVAGVADYLSHKLSEGPNFILNTLLNIVGGKQNILHTVAIGYTVVFLFRPLLRTVFSEG